MKVISTEAGIEIAVTIVERIESRKTRMTMTAIARPSMPSTASDSIDCSMNGAWSKTIVKRVFKPMSVSSCVSAAVTACETATMLPASVFVTERVSASLPSTRE